MQHGQLAGPANDDYGRGLVGLDQLYGDRFGAGDLARSQLGLARHAVVNRLEQSCRLRYPIRNPMQPLQPLASMLVI
jgi:hypothetical protein